MIMMKKTVFLLIALLFCLQGKGQSPLVIHPHEDEPANLQDYTSVFLAGTIDMGNSVDW